LEPFLKDLVNVLDGHFTILVSDDGSGSEQEERLRHLILELKKDLLPSSPHLADPVFHHPNSGKGSAIRRGWEQGLACGDHDRFAFADADGAVSAPEILRASRRMDGADAPDVLFASRVKMLGRTITRDLRRHVAGRVFATLVHLVSGTEAYDTQCGFKILTAKAYGRVRGDLMSPGFAFDVELLMLLERAGLRVEEFPVDWNDVPGSKVHLLRDSLRMAREIVRIRDRIDAMKGEGSSDHLPKKRG
jgi:glycosyltransferase involved in cell wall biosynthesis